MKIFIIAGPSGVGKSHLINELSKKGIHPLEVYTDREKRPTEIDVTDRVYLSQEEFTNTLSEFIYWFNFQGNRYGYKKEDIDKNKMLKRSTVFNIPPTFLNEMLEKLPEAISIYLSVNKSNFRLLKKRMISRDISPDDNEVERKKKIKHIDARLAFALEELSITHEIEDAIRKSQHGRVFTITDNSTLYEEVIPYILMLNGYFIGDYI